MRTKTTAFLGALLLTSTAFAQVNDADSTGIHSAPVANWQGLSNHPTNNPGITGYPPVYELPPEQPSPTNDPQDPSQSFECSVENGCMTPEQACALGGDMYCQPSPYQSFECSVENGCMTPAQACALGGDSYCN